MAIPVKDQMKYWGAGLVALVLVLWLLGNVMLPFVAGAAIAYFLDPVADRLERLGCTRVIATLIITLVAVFVFVVAALILIPTVINQTSALIGDAPVYSAKLQAFLQDKIPTLMEPDSALRKSLDSIGQTLREHGGQLLSTVITSAFTVIDVAVFIIVVPVVAFYLLLDWDRMIAVIDSWLPLDHKAIVRTLALEVDAVLAGFVRGQLSVGAILGAFYAAALMITGLKFGLIVGLLAGLLSFIPYVGAVFGGVLAIGLALFQFWDEPWLIGVVAVIFVIGQMVEGNFLSPKLVGGSVGLHPVWLMFSLSASGAIFGFVGLLVAVPLAAMIGVFSRFGIRQYQAGRLYRGLEDPD
ncbi:MAG TPA: AI-2E family transporter [Rhodobacteraceae bacterium]|jgi:predicted PurR-regulated permease PerM|nr:AI-2E family transporter [Paracoccaceae bacterium]